MFIELHDYITKDTAVLNINHIQLYWYDREEDVVIIRLLDDNEFRPAETYEEVKQLIQQSMLNEAQSQAQAVVSQFPILSR